MTTLFMDPFVQYGGVVANMLNGVWAAVQGAQALGTPSWDTTGKTALNVSTVGGAPSENVRRVLPATKTALITGLHYGVDSLPSVNGGNNIYSWRKSDNTVIADLWCDTSGHVYLTNAAGATVATTTTPVIVSQNFHHLEFKLDVAGGTFVLRVDDADGTGTPAINASGLTLLTPIGQMAFKCPNLLAPSSNQWFRDLIVRDTVGSVNNGFNGDETVVALFAAADTTTAGWTPRYYHEIGAGILDNTASNAAVTAATATSLNMGSGDFTIETFVRFKVLPTTGRAVIASRWDETNNQRSYQLYLGGSTFNGGNIVFQTSTDGLSGTAELPISYPWTPDLDHWYAVVIVRASGELLLFIDGIQMGLPIADSRTYFAGTAPFAIGAQVEGTSTVTASTYLDGWFDEYRVTVGFARYTTNYTPTTVAFTRGSGDPEWADVALLCGFDTIQDESSFARTLTSRNGSVQFTVHDGPAIGAWSTIGGRKITPDDNSFIEAPFLPATNILTLNAQPANNDTVTVGTKVGPAAAVYTFKTSLSGSAFEVLIDSSLQQTLANLYNAINIGPGIGTKYGTGTTANIDVFAVQLPAGQMEVVANVLGTGGNSIASTVSLTNGGGWTAATLLGGVDIPGPSDFHVEALPPHTTIISAIQLNIRMWKSDAGPGTVQPALVAPLGGVAEGAAHALTLTPVFYPDIIEVDPDTSGPISPTTIINGKLRLDRTA